MLIAKTIQSLANRLERSDESEESKRSEWVKEPYMKVMEPFITQNSAVVKDFLLKLTVTCVEWIRWTRV